MKLKVLIHSHTLKLVRYQTSKVYVKIHSLAR